LKQNPHTTGGEGYEEYEAPIWQNDEESNTCTLCQIHFTTLRRKVMDLWATLLLVFDSGIARRAARLV
jgi:hypothetical protein